MTTRRALVVDDDPVTRLVLGHMLRSQGWETVAASDTPEADARLRTEPFDLVISDFRLPSGTGIDLLDVMGESDVVPPFVLLTGVIEFSSVVVESDTRPTARLTKPVSSEALRAVLREIFPDGAP